MSSGNDRQSKFYTDVAKYTQNHSVKTVHDIDNLFKSYRSMNLLNVFNISN